ncbi:hypothetical protein GCM10023214_50620 [Amycolatopsis dongchuanensis]|uniref:Uncharacterized protein n=1 Tax=Amycolatopsis dongchuanensis TaxID=1070866 RepID=A0ABP9R4J6_9PSEU
MTESSLVGRFQVTRAAAYLETRPGSDPKGWCSPHEWMQLLQLVLRFVVRLLRQVLTGC